MSVASPHGARDVGSVGRGVVTVISTIRNRLVILSRKHVTLLYDRLNNLLN
jgi:hypothetical protein